MLLSCPWRRPSHGVSYHARGLFKSNIMGCSDKSLRLLTLGQCLEGRVERRGFLRALPTVNVRPDGRPNVASSSVYGLLIDVSKWDVRRLALTCRHERVRRLRAKRAHHSCGFYVLRCARPVVREYAGKLQRGLRGQDWCRVLLQWFDTGGQDNQLGESHDGDGRDRGGPRSIGSVDV